MKYILVLINFVFFFLLICAAKGFQVQESKQTATSTQTPFSDNSKAKSFSSNLLKKDQSLSPVDTENKQDDDNGLIEVKEEEIPEGAVVYVLEEPLDKPTDGEILQTANNIVFRPLFRYREKQEAQRRNYNNRIRRRYFVPRRSYRQTYTYPYYYYPYRYY